MLINSVKMVNLSLYSRTSTQIITQDLTQEEGCQQQLENYQNYK